VDTIKRKVHVTDDGSDVTIYDGGDLEGENQQTTPMQRSRSVEGITALAVFLASDANLLTTSVIACND